MSDTFLTPEEIAILTGRKFKRLQIEQLRKMGIPFWVNAVNMPIVARATIEGRKEKVEPPKPKWVPNVLKGRD
jgi:hypothetical protein